MVKVFRTGMSAAALLAVVAMLTACCGVCPMRMACPMEKEQGMKSGACPMPRGAFVESLKNRGKYFEGGVWDIAFKALEEMPADIPDGETKILGDDILLRVSTYKTKPAAEAAIETHRDYIDIQMMIEGEETWRWFPVPALTVSQQYDRAKDVTFYENTGLAPLAQFHAQPGYFAVFTPADAHTTQIIAPGESEPRACRKAVVKVRASLVCPRAK